MYNTPQFWYKKNWRSFLLLPFSWVYCLIVGIRRFYYQKIFKPKHFSVPIIVVGNVTVGGTGKTPVVIALAEMLKRHGFKPGIVSRGYAGNATEPQLVTLSSSSREVGDEALVIVRRTNCPMVVGKKRVRAVAKLLAESDCNIVISDDGLQHYALARDLEIVVLDSQRGLGNGWCLPAGPMRESAAFLQAIYFKENNFCMFFAGKGYSMNFVVGDFVNVNLPQITKIASDFSDQPIHAVAGIGNPEKFFTTLQTLGLKFIKHPFPDHYVYHAKDLPFGNETVLMTEKDAVKCEQFATDNFWFLPIRAVFNSEFERDLMTKISGKYIY